MRPPVGIGHGGLHHIPLSAASSEPSFGSFEDEIGQLNTPYA